jgi:hypothetical protein
MATSVFPTPSTSSRQTTLPTAVPAGLTLRNTYTSSQSGLSFPVNEVYVVVVGGGGGGGSGQAGNSGSGTSGGASRPATNGGGGGAVLQGWVPA